MAEALVFAEEPRSERDKWAVWRENPDENGVGEVTSRGEAVNFVDVSVSCLTRERGRGGGSRDGKGERRSSSTGIRRGQGSRGNFVIEVRKGVEDSCWGDRRQRQRSKSWTRQDDDIVQVGNEVVGEVQRRS
jgi:hypothetical protein